MLAVVPVVSGGSCPSPAAVLGTVGLGPVCQAVSAAASAAGSVAGHVAEAGAESVLDSLSGWVSAGATWLLAQIGSVISATTTIDLGASWFTAHYRTMAVLSGVIIVPLLLLGIMQSIYRQNASTLVRSVVLNVPLALLLTAVAVKLVQLGLAVTDAMSAVVAQGSGLDSGHFLSSVATGLSVTSVVGPATPAFLVFLGSLVVVLAAMMVWIELLIRSAAVYVAVLFLPLALASLAWPTISHWCRRLVDTLVALILGKFVIVAVLSLAVGALAGGTGSTPSGAAGGGGGGFTAVIGGAALLLLAAFSPWALFRLLPFLEAGAVGHLEALGQRGRRTATGPARMLAHEAIGVPAAALAANAVGSLFSAGSRAVESATGSAGSAGSAGSGGGGGGAPGSTGGAAGVGGNDGGSPGPLGSGPEAEPSTAESTGVGSMSAPGHNIPMWGDDPAVNALGNQLLDDLASDAGSPPSPRLPGTAPAGGVPLPAAAPTRPSSPPDTGTDERGPASTHGR